MSRRASCCCSVSLALAVLLGSSPAARAIVYRVPADVATVGGALAAATAGDTVLISAGQWLCSTSLHSGVAVVGVGAPGSVKLDAQGSGAVLTLTDASAGTSLYNLVLMNGAGNPVSGVAEGGGLYALRSSPTLARVRITACSAYLGGGAYFEEGAPALSGCQVDHNQASFGAGLAFDRSTARLDTCSVASNSASLAAGGLLVESSATVAMLFGDISSNTSGGDGGGTWFLGGSGNLQNVTLQSNSATGDGGAVFAGQGASLNLTQDVMWKNQANRGGGAYLGCSQPAQRPRLPRAARPQATVVCGSYVLTNNTLFQNDATSAGGAVAANDLAQVHLLYNILAFASSGGGLACLDMRTALDVRCNDVWHNAPSNYGVGCSSDLTNPALGNLNVNPYWCDPLNGVFTLCANTTLANNPLCGAGIIGAFDIACPKCATATRRLSWGELRRNYLSLPSTSGSAPASR